MYTRCNNTLRLASKYHDICSRSERPDYRDPAHIGLRILLDFIYGLVVQNFRVVCLSQSSDSLLLCQNCLTLTTESESKAFDQMTSSAGTEPLVLHLINEVYNFFTVVQLFHLLWP